jgi:hypothetical protein
MSSSEQLLEAIRRKHGRNLERLRRKALSDAATTAEMSGTGPGRKLPPRYETRSVLDNTLEVRILASHDPIDDDVVIVGNYPAGSKLVFISVSARHARTGSIATIDPTEADAWGASLAPDLGERVRRVRRQARTNRYLAVESDPLPSDRRARQPPVRDR